MAHLLASLAWEMPHAGTLSSLFVAGVESCSELLIPIYMLDVMNKLCCPSNYVCVAQIFAACERDFGDYYLLGKYPAGNIFVWLIAGADLLEKYSG
jgi:hypothetical protein